MDKRCKDIMRSLVSRLCHILVGIPVEGDGFLPGNLDRELERVGVAPDGMITPLDALPDLYSGELRIYRVAATLLTPLLLGERVAARHEIIERAAYTWINRLFALRAMEVRDLIEGSILRGEEVYGGLSEKMYFLRQDAPERANGPDRGWWAVVEDACRVQAKALPGLFALDDPTAALRPAPAALIQCIELLSGIKPVLPDVRPADLDATFADPDAIGWAYQFYQQEAKAAIDAKCKRGGKVVSRAEMSAKTQLFTESYMVQWLLQNSLGRSYHEAYPHSSLPATWEYYVRPEMLDVADPFGLGRLTLLDPCMGSGHFLRAAFDMFVAMYRERRPELSAREIAYAILSQHLHGVDLDPRAAQLTALTLYLRAWELVRDEQRRMRMPITSIYIPPAMNLVATPSGLTKGALERHLQRMPEDRLFRSLLEDVFSGLEQADILGSLLRPREYLENAIAELVKLRNLELVKKELHGEESARKGRDGVNLSSTHLSEIDKRKLFFDRSLELETDWATSERLQAIQKLATDDPDRLREQLLETIANSFHIEAGNTEDVSVAFFGREAEQGIRLIQVLARRYAVVVTNPPYLGSAYMDNLLKNYITRYYPSGKRDVYAAFILRCIELCQFNGRVAMVTMQSWMFLRHYTDIRAIPGERSEGKRGKNRFKGLLRETSLELLAHLDAHAFEEISGEVVKNVMFTLKNCVPDDEHRIVAFRLVGLKSPEKKKSQLQSISKPNNITSTPKQYDFLAITSFPLVYYLNEELIGILTQGKKLSEVASVRQGLATADDDRFIRYTWEIPISSSRWVTLTKGGGYSRWFGLNWYHVDWELVGTRMKSSGRSVLRNVHAYFIPGWSYSRICAGNLSFRRFDVPGCIGDKGPGIYAQDQSLVAVMQSRVLTCILRAISPQLAFEVATITQSPLPKTNDGALIALASLAEACKRLIVANNCTERNFAQTLSNLEYSSVACWLHTTEGLIEYLVCQSYNLAQKTIRLVCDETGTPAGWYPLISAYDTIPALPGGLDLPDLPQELFDYLAGHKRITLSDTEFKRSKANLKALYEAGPKAKGVEQEESGEHAEKSEDEEELMSGAHVPIPTETFLEELSVKMELHPISVYWLLEELRSEGVRCRPEERRLLEDRLSVLVLRLLGHRWPRQLEAGEPVPLWAEQYGIMPQVSGTGCPTLAERMRERLYHEDGALAVQQINVQLQELTGHDLEQWLRRSFFSNHIRQFKQRPIAWHLASTPTKKASATGKGTPKRRRSGAACQPAFECLLYYHACGKGALARIRTQYIEPLLNAERYRIELYHAIKEEEAEKTATPPLDKETDDPREITLAKERMRELEDFVLRLQRVEDRGFAAPELEQLLALEPLDRWCGDGYNAPASPDAWLRHEQEWRVDINDGVRVNIAPLQLADVLASDVLKPADAKKALSDRMHWRADERRWVRDGKLPRCGWMADTKERGIER